MFSKGDFGIYEHEGQVCINVTLNKPALFDTFVQLVESHGSATSKLCICMCTGYLCYKHSFVSVQ